MAYPQQFTHVIRYNHIDAINILNGTCYITPKVDGTIGTIWFEDGIVKAGSRKQVLSQEKDNVGFCAWLNGDAEEAKMLRRIAEKYPDYVFYGEWGVGGVAAYIKDYDEGVSNFLWLFDIYDMKAEEYLHPEKVQEIFSENFLSDWTIPILAVVNHPSFEDLMSIARENDFLLKEANHPGEGIVIRRPDFRNARGEYRIGKLTLSEFNRGQIKPEEREFVNPGEMEFEIVKTYITQNELEKTWNKLNLTDHRNIASRKKKLTFAYMVFREVVLEDGLADYLSINKKAVIDFRILYNLTESVCRSFLKEKEK